MCNRMCEYVLLVVKSYNSDTVSASLHRGPAYAGNLEAIFTFLFIHYFVSESGSTDLQLVSRSCTF